MLNRRIDRNIENRNNIQQIQQHIELHISTKNKAQKEQYIGNKTVSFVFAVIPAAMDPQPAVEGSIDQCHCKLLQEKRNDQNTQYLRSIQKNNIQSISYQCLFFLAVTSMFRHMTLLHTSFITFVNK